MKIFLITAIASLALLTTSCMAQTSKKEETQPQAIFPKGELGPSENFTGKAWNYGLVANDTTYNSLIRKKE